MIMDITEVVKVIMEQIKETVRAETVIGAPVQCEDSVIVPVSKVSFGFGAGGGVNESAQKGSGMGAGVGVSMEPIAFIVVSKGKAHLVSVKNREETVNQILNLVPTVLEAIVSMTSKKKDEKEC
jgi:sporulation protein YtfJ